MANNYLQFSFSVPFTKEQSDYFIGVLAAWDDIVNEFDDDIELDASLMTVARELGAEKDGDDIGDIEHSIEDDGTLCLWAEEFGNVGNVVKLLQHVLKKFDLDLKIGFAWAETSSRPRLNEFGGGAVAFTKDSETWLNTHQWLEQQGVAV